MWPVSDAYKEAVVKPSRKWKAEVRVTYKNGAQSVFTDKTIMNGITINSQMLSGDAGSNTIDIGAVPEKKIELTLIDSDSDLHRYAGARFSVHTFLMLENEEYEEVPMGVFFVDSSAITRQGTNIHIVGYDGMVTFQYNLTDSIRAQLKNQLATEAAQILASYSSCGFNQDLSGFPNGDLMLNFDSAQVVTGWDGIMWIAQLMGCFGRINRQNNLEFVPIKFEWEYFDEWHTNGKIIETRTIQASERYDNTTFSDDRMHIVGVAMPGDEGYITSGGTGGLEQDANITVLLEKNPIIKKDLKSIPEILEEIRLQLWSVYFYAFKVDIENDPALDAGDVVRLKGGVINGTNKNNDLYGFITHNEWHYRERQTITSSGQMPISEDNTTSGSSGNTQFYVQPKSQSEKLLNAISGQTNEMVQRVGDIINIIRNELEPAASNELVAYDGSKFGIYPGTGSAKGSGLKYYDKNGRAVSGFWLEPQIELEKEFFTSAILSTGASESYVQLKSYNLLNLNGDLIVVLTTEKSTVVDGASRLNIRVEVDGNVMINETYTTPAWDAYLGKDVEVNYG